MKRGDTLQAEERIFRPILGFARLKRGHHVLNKLFPVDATDQLIFGAWDNLGETF